LEWIRGDDKQQRSTGQARPTPRSYTGNRRDVRGRARKYLEKVPHAVSGQGGHNQTFWAARCLVWGFNIHPDDALDILLRDYNPRCLPEWSEWELRHKVLQADVVPFDKERGWLLHADRPLHDEHAHRNGFTGSAEPGGDGPCATGDEPPAPSPGNPPKHLTDTGNARRLVERHGKDLRHCHPWKKWLCWVSGRWQVDARAETTLRVKETIGELFRQAIAEIEAVRKQVEEEGESDER
jgi:hypothetical protein